MAKKKARPLSLPEDVLEIYRFHQLPERSVANVCGRIIDFLPTSKSRGVDYQKQITIKDIHEDPNPDVLARQPNELVVKLFGSDTKWLPPVDQVGNVIFFKRLKAVTWQAQRRGLSSWDTHFVLFLNEGQLDAKTQHAHEVVKSHTGVCMVRPEKAGDVNRELQDYASMMHQRFESRRAASIRDPPRNAPTGPRAGPGPLRQSLPQNYTFYAQGQPAAPRENVVQHYRPDGWYDSRFSTISDLTTGSYSATIIGEIVKLFDGFQYLDVYVTDYTSSPLLYDYQADRSSYPQYSFQGPAGRMTLKVELHDPHRRALTMNFAHGDLVMLRNVKCKMAGSGDGLEATMWPDKKFADKLHVVIPDPDDVRVRDLEERRRAFKGESRSGDAPGASNKSKKKREKKQRQAKARLEAAQRGNYSTELAVAPSKADEAPTRLQEEPPVRDDDDYVMVDNVGMTGTASNEQLSRPSGANPRVTTSSSHDFSTLDEIINNPKRQIVILNENGVGTSLMEVPFVNVNHRVLLRVVDYSPRDVFKFPKPLPASVGAGQDSPPEFDWSFDLLAIAGDADTKSPRGAEQQTISIHVDDEAGMQLFGVRARDLVNDEDEQKALAKAEEKFFGLVGSGLPNAKEASSNESSGDPSPTDAPKFGISWPFWERSRGKKGPLAISPPFEACVREFGLRCDCEQEEGCGDCICGWRRIYGLHSTKIVEANDIKVKTDIAGGRTRHEAIVLDDSDDDPMDVSR